MYTAMCNIASGKPSSVLCDDLEGWDGGASPRGRDVWIHTADSPRGTAGTHTAP